MRFCDRLKEYAPVVERAATVANGTVLCKVNFENRYQLDWAKRSPDYIRRATQIAEYQERGSVLLVSEERMPAIKTAIQMINLLELEDLGASFEEDLVDHQGYDELRLEPDIILMDLQQNRMEEDDWKRCLQFLQSLGERDNIIFCGLPHGERLGKLLENIAACRAASKVILITPEQSKEPCILHFRASQKARMHVLENLPEGYYESLMKKLLRVEGIRLDGITCEELVKRGRNLAGEDLSEEFLCWMLDEGNTCAIQIDIEEGETIVEHACKVRRAMHNDVVSVSDFRCIDLGKSDALDTLNAMVGLSAMKRIAYEQAALAGEILRNPAIGRVHNNMIFAGNPGTGKTTVAELFAGILAENGNCNHTFTVATRSDIIGSYVGHTSPMIAKLFDRTRNGILFVDEAGFFLNRNAGGFVEEAIREFVRYMEKCPDVTVIFAMYRSETEAFLRLDEGLTSRISRIVHFEDYEESELREIALNMWQQRGYQVAEDVWPTLDRYIHNKKQEPGFGNAREIRKVVETSIIGASVRHMEKHSRDLLIRLSDVEYALEQLEKNAEVIVVRKFGFGY